MDYKKLSIEKHLEYNWKLKTESKVPLESLDDLATYYSPWVAAPCLEIEKDPKKSYDLTWRKNTIAVVSDWTAVLWLGNIWGLASLPVMEWKCILFKHFWLVDAVPIVLKTQNPDEIINIVENISPTFWWINLEDIKAPECFYIEEKLRERLDIPVFHDDQHWTAIVTLAWIINAIKITGREVKDTKIVVTGAWAGAIACIKLLREYWFKNIITFDSRWVIYSWRDNLNKYKEDIANLNTEDFRWNLQEAVKNRDIFIGLSGQPNSITPEDVSNMNDKSIIFAVSNPDPEITPEEAKKWWAYIISTWRSDYPNQINNVLAFPWIFRWILDAWIPNITEEHKLIAAKALASAVETPNPDKIIPGVLEEWIVDIVANAIKNNAKN